MLLAASALIAGGGVAAAAGPAMASPCVTSANSGTCGPYTDANIYDSSGSDTYVNNNVWNPISGASETLTSNGPESWDANATMPAGNTAVVSYPDTQQLLGEAPLSGFTSLTSSFTENLNAHSGTMAEAAYDIWSNNWADEVMIWVDNHGQDLSGDTNLGSLTIGGQGFTVYCNGNCTGSNTGERIVSLNTNETTGTVDILATYNALIAHNWLPSSTNLTAVDFGPEFSSTGGTAEDFQLSCFGLDGNGTGLASCSGTQQAPAVTTNTATGVTSSGATLNGSVNPEGAATTYQFDYGTTTSYGSVTPAGGASAGSGSTAVNESAALSGLAAGTTYHYRIEATNSAGTTFGADQQFTTSSAPVAPVVTTTAATGVTSSGATLNGTVNPEGQATTYQFEYGTTTAYGTTSPATPGSAGSGTTAVNESSAVTGLAASTTYHYRLNATNATGTTHGGDQQFTTSAAGGGSTVAFDATAGAKVANASSLSWTQAVGSGSNRALLVDFTVGTSNDAGCAPTVTDNGTAMSEITAVHDNSQHAGALTVWGLVNPPSGTNTIATSVRSCSGGTPLELTGGSESLTGVSQATPINWVHAIAAGSSGQSSVGVTSASTSNLVGEFVANGSSVTGAVSPVVQKFLENQDNNSGAGNTAGGYAPGAAGTVTGKFNLSADWWGAAAVDIPHA